MYTIICTHIYIYVYNIFIYIYTDIYIYVCVYGCHYSPLNPNVPTYFDTKKITCAHVIEQVDSVLTAATRALLVEVPWHQPKSVDLRRQFLCSFFPPLNCYLRISCHMFCYISWLKVLIYVLYITYATIVLQYTIHIIVL